MARASLRGPQGTRVHSTGTHASRRKFDVTPPPEREELHAPNFDADQEFRQYACISRMMRDNRAAGL